MTHYPCKKCINNTPKIDPVEAPKAYFILSSIFEKTIFLILLDQTKESKKLHINIPIKLFFVINIVFIDTKNTWINPFKNNFII